VRRGLALHGEDRDERIAVRTEPLSDVALLSAIGPATVDRGHAVADTTLGATAILDDLDRLVTLEGSEERAVEGVLIRGDDEHEPAALLHGFALLESRSSATK
jgi:hypothetical protein